MGFEFGIFHEFERCAEIACTRTVSFFVTSPTPSSFTSVRVFLIRRFPTSVSGAPAIRRVFTFTQRDANGRDLQARAFQTVVVKGQTPYIITATAPAPQSHQVSPEFDQMVQSFQFS